MNGNILVIICLTLMLILLMLRRKRYNVSFLKVFPLTICVTGMGLLGTYILYFLENGLWYGRSFFGAVLFFPILLFPVALLFKINLIDLLSYATIPGMLLLAVYKWNCYIGGCCGGKVLWFSKDGIPTHFPSQIAEMSVAIIITIILLVFERNEKTRKKIYPICLIIYGATRYILDYFRWEQPQFFLGLTPGAFWSIVALFIGCIWLFVSILLKKEDQ